MAELTLEALLEAGAHFGHQTKRWNPKMKPYILTERSGIHLINLKKTLDNYGRAKEIIHTALTSGQSILFVGTKKQAQHVVRNEAQRCGAFYVSERWLGGMLTNFSTIRRSVETLENIERMEADGTFKGLTKKEVGKLRKKHEKLVTVLGGVRDMKYLPGAVIVVDSKKERIAVAEARKLEIPIISILDTNCDPEEVDCAIPANDDAIKTLELIIAALADAVAASQNVIQAKKAEEQKKRDEQRKKAAQAREAAAKKVVKKKEPEPGEKAEQPAKPEKAVKKVVKRKPEKEEAPASAPAPVKEEAPVSASAPAPVKEEKTPVPRASEARAKKKTVRKKAAKKKTADKKL